MNKGQQLNELNYYGEYNTLYIFNIGGNAECGEDIQEGDSNRTYSNATGHVYRSMCINIRTNMGSIR